VGLINEFDQPDTIFLSEHTKLQISIKCVDTAISMGHTLFKTNKIQLE